MNDSGPEAAAAKQQPLHVRVNTYGLVVLLVGLASAALIFIFAADEGPDATAALESGRSYEYNLERIGGMAAVYAARFNRWLSGLWHGRPLAYTVAVLSVVIALVFFWVARMVFVRSPRGSDSGSGA